MEVEGKVKTNTLVKSLAAIIITALVGFVVLCCMNSEFLMKLTDSFIETRVETVECEADDVNDTKENEVLITTKTNSKVVDGDIVFSAEQNCSIVNSCGSSEFKLNQPAKISFSTGENNTHTFIKISMAKVDESGVKHPVFREELIENINTTEISAGEYSVLVHFVGYDGGMVDTEREVVCNIE